LATPALDREEWAGAFQEPAQIGAQDALSFESP